MNSQCPFIYHNMHNFPLPTLQALSSSAIEALRSYHSDAPALSQVVGKYFSAGFMRHMARILSLPEISRILQAEGMRESGLALARSGKLTEAEQLIQQAGEMARQGDLTGAAYVAAETFQLAAESYLAYRYHRYLSAYEKMITATQLSAQLAEEYRFKMGYRVIHLARNIMHIDNVLGDSKSALQDALKLSRYISGDLSAWPYEKTPHGQTAVTLYSEEYLLAQDEVAGEIALAFRNNVSLANAFDKDNVVADVHINRFLLGLARYYRGDSEPLSTYILENSQNDAVLTPQIRRSLNQLILPLEGGG
jgi:hypothetical protein